MGVVLPPSTPDENDIPLNAPKNNVHPNKAGHPRDTTQKKIVCSGS